MRCGFRGLGLAALVAVLQVAASGAAIAGVDYTGQTASAVSVQFSDLPASTNLVVVDQTSGAIVSPAIVVSGSGSLDIPLVGLIHGDYYVLAQQAGQWIAQTVVFHS
jgi:hypothetical protein